MIHIYYIITTLLIPIYLVVVIIRVLQKKESISRLQERVGVSQKVRPQGFLLWIHASSVGESIIAINLVSQIFLLWPSINILITTGNILSSNLLSTKLPSITNHLLPIDNPFFVRNFLKKWTPNFGIFIESEFWPAMLYKSASMCKLILINARISDLSFSRWSKIPIIFQKIIECFDKVITQSNSDFYKFCKLGVNINNIINLGNIKFSNLKLEVELKNKFNLEDYLKSRKVILFASSHLADEKIILGILKEIKNFNNNCYFILIPRHPKRGKEIVKLCKKMYLKCSLRSNKNLPDLSDDLYIVDKIGELGLFYSISYITFIGGSFKNGGHNCLEAAHFKNVIIFGPNMSNFLDISNEMLKDRAAIKIDNEKDLINKLKQLLKAQEPELNYYRENALKFVNKKQMIVLSYLDIIKKYIDSHV